MKKILTLALTVVMVLALFTSCGKASSISPANFFKDYSPEEYPSLTKVEKLEAYSEMTAQSSSTDLIAFTKREESKKILTIYNAKQNKEVLSLSFEFNDNYFFEPFSAYGNVFFTIIHGKVTSEKTTYTTTLYTSSGAKVATADGIVRNSNTSLTADDIFTRKFNLIRFDNAIYQIAEDGSVTTLKEKSVFTPELPDIDFYNGKYYVSLKEDGKPGVIFYDNSLEVVSRWEYDLLIDTNSSYSCHIMNDASVIFQLNEKLPADAEKYDYTISGNKYNIFTWSINPKNGSAKSINSNVYLLSNEAVDEFYSSGKTPREDYGIAKKYENIAFVMYVKDQKLSNITCVALSNNGSVKGELFTNLPLFNTDISSFDDNIYPLGDGMFAYRTILDTVIVINAKGKKIIEISSELSDSMDTFGDYYIIDGAVYDKSFNLKFDFEEEKYELYDIVNNSIILEKDDKLFLYTGNSDPIAIDLETGNYIETNVSYALYYVYDYQNRAYHYYNDMGEKLFTSYKEASIVKNIKNVVIFNVTDSEGNTSFYRISE